MTNQGIVLIAAERTRQIEKEGWSPTHDDGHRYAELARTAAELAVYGTDAQIADPDGPDAWGLVRKHKRDRIRMLTIAGALIAAEIDRELRRLADQEAHDEV